LFLSWFIQPRLYWFPAGLPFLRLGETIFHDDFPVRWLSAFQAELLQGWQERLAELAATRREHSEYYYSNITAMYDERGTGESGAAPRLQPARMARGAPLLRFPVLLADRAIRHRVLEEQGGVTLGMSGMYPDTVARIPQLAGMLAERRFPRAETIADSLVTLPTHPLVSERDRERICALMNGRCARPEVGHRVPVRT
jgi:dTDP-4-amino-4,6-dideoxygalactose transaminase